MDHRGWLVWLCKCGFQGRRFPVSHYQHVCECEWVHRCTWGGDGCLNGWMNERNNELLVGNILTHIHSAPPNTHTILTAQKPQLARTHTHTESLIPVWSERVHCLQLRLCQRGHTNWDVVVMIKLCNFLSELFLFSIKTVGWWVLSFKVKSFVVVLCTKWNS